MNKKAEITNLIEKENPDVLCFTETLDKRNPELTEAEAKINGYETFLGKNPQRGTVIYVKETLNPKRSLEHETNDYTEHVWCSIKYNDENILIGNIYRSPNSSDNNNEKLLNLLKNKTNEKFDKIFITGDFNLPNINWQTGLSSNIYEISFIESFNDAYLFQHIEKPTRYRQGQKSNILDLVFTRENSDIIDIEYLSPIGKSDHLTLKLITNIDKIAMEDDTPPRFDFKRCNITDFRRLIKETDWAVLHKLNVEECWNLIYSKLDEGMEKFVPKVDIKSRKKSPPWMNPFVKKSIKKKHKLFKKLFNSNNSYVYKLYMNARNESARIVKNA